ncbi:MAG: hypothetical protein KKB59_02390, partial [Spirochaetes bacterium]|nr:hypothetical protein [Spirochaetota bacterium]
MRITLERVLLIATLAAVTSCATAPGSAPRESDELAGASAGGALAAGMLIKATEARRVPARKPRALLAIASPMILGSAIDMDVLEERGYSRWREARRTGLLDVRSIRIAYSARLPEGGTELQSGMLYIPEAAPDGPRALTWVVFLKGTEHLRDYVPSRGGGMERTFMEAVAALGYAVWAPDYAGMGDGRGAQEYCVPESMAASALDGLAASREFVLGLPEYGESGRLAVMVYSQGGLAAMATL